MDAYNKYQEAVEAYRALEIGDDEYLAARKIYFDHLAALDVAVPTIKSPEVWRDEDGRVSCARCVASANEGTTFVLMNPEQASHFHDECAMGTGPVFCGYCDGFIPRAA